MLEFRIDDERCTRCGQCVFDCPTHIIDANDTEVPSIQPEKEVLCIRCQHCLSICPTAALSIFGKNPDDSLPISADSLPGLDQMVALVKSRRSIRQYRDENVDADLLHQLMATVVYAPTGVNRQELTFTVIDDLSVMHSLKRQTYAVIDTAEKEARVPARMSGLVHAARAYFAGEGDTLFRGAPHALVVSAPKEAPCAEQDVVLALAYFELLSQSAGLGTVWWGMFKMVAEAFPELKPIYHLSPGHVYYAMLFGLPSIQYSRVPQREDGAVVKRLGLK